MIISAGVTRGTLSAYVVFLLLIGMPPAEAIAQFVKRIDENGRAVYSQDPSYDYDADDPPLEDQRRNRAQVRQLEDFIEYRAGLPPPRAPKPHATIRTGRAVCLRRISPSRLSIGCD